MLYIVWVIESEITMTTKMYMQIWYAAKSYQYASIYILYIYICVCVYIYICVCLYQLNWYLCLCFYKHMVSWFPECNSNTICKFTWLLLSYNQVVRFLNRPTYRAGIPCWQATIVCWQATINYALFLWYLSVLKYEICSTGNVILFCNNYLQHWKNSKACWQCDRGMDWN